MYTITCDGHPLLDVRDDEYILDNPRVKTEVNTVGEGSFKILYNHPNIDKLQPLRSVFEVKDEYGVLFRGRMTEDTQDFDNCKAVDLEGIMACLNDSAVRPYVFPDDFLDNDEYKAAAAETAEQVVLDGGVVRFYLQWLIDQHNAQVEDFQRFKLGNVTVYDKNNFIERSASDYPDTWKEVSDKLFNSSLGGYLCIRYEEDGNYIDYLREFTEINEQGITYGENMLDISRNANAGETYSAIIPFGAESKSTEENGDVYEGTYGDIVGGSSVTKKLTIESLPDGDITDDIVKKGDTLYSKRALAAYGWRLAPRDETTWEDVNEANTLQSRGVEYLCGDSLKIPNTINVTAVDLNCTDKQIRAFRIYKKIPVYSLVHGMDDNFDLTALDCDLLNPQNTKITVGKTVMTMTEYQSKQQSSINNILGKYATNEKVARGFKVTESLIEKKIDGIDLSVYAKQDALDATNEQMGNISLALDAIDLSVYAKQDALEESFKQFGLSGRNYILYGKGDNKQGFFEDFSTVTDEYGAHTLRVKGGAVHLPINNGFILGCRDYEVGKQMTLSCDIMITKWDVPEGADVLLWEIRQSTSNDETTWYPVIKAAFPRVGEDGCVENEWVHVEETVTIPEYHEGDHDISNIVFLNQSPNVEARVAFRLKNVKLEYGDKATEWSPAPEEYSTTAEVESKISVALESIDLSVNKSFSDLQGTVQEAEAKLNLAVLTDEDGNLKSAIHIGADLLTIDSEHFTLGENGQVTIDSDDFKLDENGHVQIGLFRLGDYGIMFSEHIRDDSVEPPTFEEYNTGLNYDGFSYRYDTGHHGVDIDGESWLVRREVNVKDGVIELVSIERQEEGEYPPITLNPDVDLFKVTCGLPHSKVPVECIVRLCGLLSDEPYLKVEKS